MKKIILLTFLIIVTVQLTFAQNSIAKLKFEEAEEAYSSDNFELTIIKLNETEKILKQTNPKILHLKILALNQLLTQPDFTNDPELIPELKKACEFYLKKFENLETNDDKFKEVYKIGEVAKQLKTDEDFDQELFAKAKSGDAEAQGKLGKYFHQKDRFGTAVKWYEKAAGQGDIPAMVLIGDIYFTKKDLVNAVKWYEIAGGKGNKSAMEEVAAIYVKGGSTYPVNIDKAIVWYKKAAELKSIKAMRQIGMIYLEGKAIQKNVNTALEWFAKGIAIEPTTKSEKFSSAWIYDQLCMLYLEGENVSKDYSKVQEYANKGISLNHEFWLKYYESYLGDIYGIGGNGIEKDYEKAFAYYSSSANKGYFIAMLRLSEMYASGKGIKKNKTLSAQWKTKYEEEKAKK